LNIITEILKYRSVSIVGIEKNTGKTESLNYILSKLHNSDKCIAVTSIGVDGESIDAVTLTSKPEITVFENMLFVTSEKHYFTKQFTAEIMNVSTEHTALGRLITARAKATGNVLISGPADTSTLQKTILQNTKLGADITIVDGALSRMSLASPSVTDAMILATGAAYSANISQLVRKTKFVCELISLDVVDDKIYRILSNINKGLWCIDENGTLHDLEIESALMLPISLSSQNSVLLQNCKILFVAGVVSDKLLDFLRQQINNLQEFTLVTKDFTKIFVTPEVYNFFQKKGGCIKVLHKTKLIAVTVNPVSPEGYVLDTKVLQQAMRENLNIPVYDVRELKN